MTYPLEVWNPLTESLIRTGHRVARHDLYGRGESGWDGQPLGPQVLAEQVLALLDLLGWEDPGVGGWCEWPLQWAHSVHAKPSW